MITKQQIMIQYEEALDMYYKNNIRSEVPVAFDRCQNGKRSVPQPQNGLEPGGPASSLELCFPETWCLGW